LQWVRWKTKENDSHQILLFFVAVDVARDMNRIMFSARKKNVARPTPTPKMKKAPARSSNLIGLGLAVLRSLVFSKHLGARGMLFFTQY
jgi:hypothetical protein